MVCSRFYGMVFGLVFVASPLSVCMVSCKFDSLDAHSKTAYVHERKFEGTSHVCMGYKLVYITYTWFWSYMVFHVWWKCEDCKVAIRPDSSTKPRSTLDVPHRSVGRSTRWDAPQNFRSWISLSRMHGLLGSWCSHSMSFMHSSTLKNVQARGMKNVQYATYATM